MKILIDNGHGFDTKGKCSPDGRLKEYEWCRDVAARIVNILKGMGYDAVLITPETKDIPLKERVRKVNDYCKRYGSKNCLCISVHNNAAGSDGKWHNATGWSGWSLPTQAPTQSVWLNVYTRRLNEPSYKAIGVFRLKNTG